MPFPEKGVILGRADQLMRLSQDGKRDGVFFLFFFFQSFDELPYGPARSDMTLESHCGCLLNQRSGMAAGQGQEAAPPPLSYTALFFEEKKAELFCLWTDFLCLIQKGLGHPGGIEDPVFLLHLHTSGS